MTLASWFSSIRRTQSRLSQTGSRRNRSRAFHRRATFEALEDRRLLSATVSFATDSETVEQSAGAFSIPVTVSGVPSSTPKLSSFATGLNSPFGVAFDAAGNLYVANFQGGTVSKVPAAGGEATTYATGLNDPSALAFDSAGNLYVANAGDGTVSIVTSSGQVSNFASGFHDPRGLAFDAAGNLYVANSDSGTVSEVPKGGGTPSNFASGLDGPDGLAFDAAGNLYVADNIGNTVSKVTPSGQVSNFASGFDGPIALAFDSAGNLYVANYDDNTVDEAIPGGVGSTFASGFDLPAGLAVQGGIMYVANLFNGTVSKVSQTVAVPFGLGGTAVDGVDYFGVTASPLMFEIGQTTLSITGTLLSDPGNNQTLTVTLGAPTGGDLGSPSVNTLSINQPAAVQFGTGSETVNESAGTFSIPVTVSGTPDVAANVFTLPFTFSLPLGMAFDAAGNLYVANLGAGTVSKVPAATGKPTIFASGFIGPNALAFDSAGNLYVANYDTDSVSKVPAGGGTPTTFAKGLSGPDALAFDSAGNLYVANLGTGTVSKVPAGGGTPTNFATGFEEPSGLAFDAAGNLYVTNNTGGTVSKVPAGGGPSTPFATGFLFPVGLAFDAAGNLYVDGGGGTVSKVPAGGGTPTTFATGFQTPTALAFDAAGNLYVASDGLGTVSKISQTIALAFTLGGTAVAGVDYSGVTASPLTLGIGQTTLNITGRLLRVPGPNQTLTVTLGVPTGGAVPGSPSVNTLTITEPAAVQFGTGTEAVNESVGTFSIPVIVAGSLSATLFAAGSGFNTPGSLAVDPAGNFYVANAGDGTVSEVSPAGKVSLFASGFKLPLGLAFHAGKLYVADTGAGTVYEVAAAGAKPITVASGFHDPTGLAFDSAGNLYVANNETGTVSEVPAGRGTFTTFATGLNGPIDLAFGPDGNLYVANLVDGTVSKVSSSGGTPSTFASGFNNPIGLAFDSVGNLYVADSENNTVDEVTPTGVVSILASGFDLPAELALVAGRMYVTDSGNNTMSQVSGLAVRFALGGSAASGVAYSGVTASSLTFGIGQTTLDITGTLVSDPGPSQTMTFTLGTPTGGAVLGSPSIDTLTIDEPAKVQFGTGSETVNESAGTFSIPVTLVSQSPTVSTFASGLDEPIGVAVDSAGNVYVTNILSGTVSKVTPAGHVSTFESGFDVPWGLAVDSAGNLYVANISDGTVSELSRKGGKPSTYASGFDEPEGLAIDSAGNLYVANVGDGTVSEVPAGGGKPFTFASGFNEPQGLAFDSAGNLYVSNFGTGTVSRVRPGGGAATTFATGFHSPAGLAFDSAGNLYVADGENNTVDEVTPKGVVSIFAAGFDDPSGLAFAAGSLYVDNSGNNTVSQVAVGYSVPFTLGGAAASGIAFRGVTSGVLTFGIGQTTADITGTLLSDPGTSPTLTFTLGTPAFGAVLGSFSVNTLTINEPAKGPAPPPTGTTTTAPLPPAFMGEERVFSGKGKHKKLVGFEFLFNGALSATGAQSTGHYHVTQKQGKKVKVLRVKSALYDPSNFSVTISVAGFNTGKAAQATITGLEGADGAAIPQFDSRL